MKLRQIMVKIHLILGSLLMPFLLMMPLSGVFYLLDMKGEATKEKAFVITETVPSDEGARTEFFNQQFTKNNISYSFENIKTSGTDFLFRPTSRTHYIATEIDGVLTMQKVVPDFTKRIIELHKGHGPKLVRTYQIVFGLSLILITLSGIWIAFVSPAYRRFMLASVILGSAFLAFAIL
jgi:hypothetical protein